MKEAPSRSQVEKLLPFLEEFNRLSRVLLKVMNRRIEKREKRIQILLSDLVIPEKPNQISVIPIDIGSTLAVKKGKMNRSIRMDWEKEMRPNRGFII